MGERAECGSSDCMKLQVDMAKDVSAALSAKTDAGIKSIRDLMIAHHDNLEKTIAEFKRTVEKDQEEMWPRLRQVETDVKVIQSSIGQDGLDAKIRKVSIEASDARVGKTWKRSALEIAAMVLATVMAALIIAKSGMEKQEPKEHQQYEEHQPNHGK